MVENVKYFQSRLGWVAQWRDADNVIRQESITPPKGCNTELFFYELTAKHFAKANYQICDTRYPRLLLEITWISGVWQATAVAASIKGSQAPKAVVVQTLKLSKFEDPWVIATQALDTLVKINPLYGCCGEMVLNFYDKDTGGIL